MALKMIKIINSLLELGIGYLRLSYDYPTGAVNPWT